MNTSSIALLTFAATALLVVSLSMLAYDWFFRYRMLLRERVRELSPQGSQDKEFQLFRDFRALSSQHEIERTIAVRLQDLIDQAGLACSLRQFGFACLSFALIGTAVGTCLNFWLTIPLVALGAAIPLLVVTIRRQVRRRKLCRQLPEAFEMISRAVRAGQTVPSALKIIADDFESPIADEFALCYEQQNLGLSREVALGKLARRTQVMELQIFVVALLVQAKSGGNLVELLDNLASTIRKRLKLRDRVRALTGEGRMQARILLTLPVAALVSLLVLSPDYAAVALQWPWLLVATAAAQAMGAIWIRKIVNFEY